MMRKKTIKAGHWHSSSGGGSNGSTGQGGKRRSHGTYSFSREEWAFPTVLTELLAQLKERRDHWVTTVDHAATFLFSMAANTVMYSADGFRINVSKGALTAVFNICMTRTPYFFKNRQKVVTVKGRTAPIFHVVKAHPRTLKSGKVINVHHHFSGLKKFNWNSYEVLITVPGRDHSDPREFTAPALFENDESMPNEETVSIKEMATTWRGHIQNQEWRQ